MWKISSLQTAPVPSDWCKSPHLATEMCASKLEIHYIFTAQRWVKKGLLGNVFPLNLFEDEGNNVGCQLGSVLKI